MPLVRIGLMAGPSEQLATIGAGVQRAMVECLDVPVRDQFQMMTEHPAGRLIYNSGYLGIERTDGIVIGQILLSRALGGAQAGVLCARGGIDRSGGDSSPEDVMITLLENARGLVLRPWRSAIPHLASRAME